MPSDAGHSQCPTCSGPLSDDGICIVCALSGNTTDARPATSGSASQITNLSSIQRFGPYDLLGEIGQEGVMGAVYQARQRATDRIVALKMLRPARMRSAEMVDRFMREVRVMGSLDHRHILPIFETGEQEGAYFFTMKLALGGSLLWQMRQGGWTIPNDQPSEAGVRQKRIASLLRSVALGVQHAHERGVLHRDLKPANILLDLDGSPFVADFGLAKHYSAELDLTHSLQVLGTPAYMAPEQAKEGGKHVSTATDVWSLGVILYELLVGRLPFDAESGWELMAKIQTEVPVRPRSLNPQIDPALENICLKCLQKVPFDRYHTPADFADALEAYLAGTLSVLDLSKAPKPIRDSRSLTRSLAKSSLGSHPVLWALSGMVVLQTVAIAILFLRNPRSGNSAEVVTAGGVTVAPRPATSVRAGDSMRFVPIPGTTVQISVYETRVRDFEPFAKEFNLVDWRNITFDGRPIPLEPDLPVANVSWTEARKFADWLTKQEQAKGRIRSSQKYRLPTDIEWSQAVGLPREVDGLPVNRDSTRLAIYPWGEAWPPWSGVGNYADVTYARENPQFAVKYSVTVGYDDGYPFLAPAGKFPPNSLGIYDLGGNVCEWCEDYYSEHRRWRVLRGGSFSDFDANTLKSAFRRMSDEDSRAPDRGFRLVLSE